MTSGEAGFELPSLGSFLLDMSLSHELEQTAVKTEIDAVPVTLQGDGVLRRAGLASEFGRLVEIQIANHADEIAKLSTPTHITAHIEVSNIELAEAARLEQIAKDVRKGPSRSLRARYENGSHTVLKTSTSGNDAATSTFQEVDAEGAARNLLKTFGESSQSFMKSPLSRGVRSRTADRLDAIYKELRVQPEDRKAYRDTIRQADTVAVTLPERPTPLIKLDDEGKVSLAPGGIKKAEPAIVGEKTKNIAEQALKGLQRIRGYLKEAAESKAKA